MSFVVQKMGEYEVEIDRRPSFKLLLAVLLFSYLHLYTQKHICFHDVCTDGGFSQLETSTGGSGFAIKKLRTRLETLMTHDHSC